MRHVDYLVDLFPTGQSFQKVVIAYCALTPAGN